MSGKPFDDKAKARLAKHILSGGKAGNEPDEDDAPQMGMKPPTTAHAQHMAEAAGDEGTARQIREFRRMDMVGMMNRRSAEYKAQNRPQPSILDRIKQRLSRLGHTLEGTQ